MDEYDISLASLYAWNPAKQSECYYLDIEDYVCVGVLNLTSTATAATTDTSILTPSTFQRRMVSDCNDFYLVK